MQPNDILMVVLLFSYAFRSLVARRRTNAFTMPLENVIVLAKGAASEADSVILLDTAHRVGLLDATVVKGAAPATGSLDILLGQRVTSKDPSLKIGDVIALPAGPSKITGIPSASGGPEEDEVWTPRSPELAALAAIGIHRSTLGRLMVVESTLLAAFGAILGVGADALIRSELGLVNLGQGPVPWSGRLSILSVGLGLGVVVALVGGFVPAIPVARLDILEAMR